MLTKIAKSRGTLRIIAPAIVLLGSLVARDTLAQDPARHLDELLNVANARDGLLLPLPSERLPQPIPLNCLGMTVIEWRPDHQLGSITGPTPEGIAVLNRLCRLARDRYPEFLRSKHLRYELHDIDLTISLIPANILLDGKDARNLNGPRFASGHRVGDDTWGIFFRQAHALFLRNDPVVLTSGSPVEFKPFARCFLHEQSHVMANAWNVRTLNRLSSAEDEKLAEEWVGWLGGYTPVCESSQTDLDAKKSSGMLVQPRLASGMQTR